MKLGTVFQVSKTMLGFILAITCLGHSTKAQRGTGTITGRVVTEDGQPLPRTLVSVIPAGAKADKILSGRLALKTDDEGNFEATGLDPAPYSITVRAPGYLPAQPPDPANPEYHYLGETVTLTMRKGGVITGIVTAANGEPVVGVEVSAVSLGSTTAMTSAFSFDISTGQIVMRQTDDRGAYRLYGLPPGKYLIMAGATGFSFGTTTPFQGQTPTYYPNSTRDTAVPLTVQSGEEISGVDIRYRGDNGFAISGKVTGATAANSLIGVQSTTLILLRRPGASDVVATTVAIPDAGQSNFGFYGVPNGEYELVAAQVGLNDENQSVSPPRRLTINSADQSGIKLALMALASIKGRFIHERPADAEARAAAAKCANPREPQPEEIVAFSRKDDPNPKPEFDLATLGFNAPAVADQQGAFTLRGLSPGRYRFAARFPDQSWYLKALTLAPANAAAAANPARDSLVIKAGEKLVGLTATVAGGAASLSGMLKTKTELPARMRVHLLPAETDAKDNVLRYTEVLADNSGAFSFAHLAPGKYLLVARHVREGEDLGKTSRPATWDAAERARLRKEAEAAKVVLELKVCQRVDDFTLHWK